MPRVRFSLLGREQVVAGGMLALGALLLALILLDVYLFYGTLVETRMRSVSVPKSTVSSGELDEVIHLLDERKDRYDALLSK